MSDQTEHNPHQGDVGDDAGNDAGGDVVENLRAFLLACARVPGGRVGEEPGLTWALSPIPGWFHNGVLRVDLDPARDDVDAAIERAMEPFRAAGRRMTWYLTDDTRPRDLSDRLAAHGIPFREEFMGMAVELDALRPEPMPDGLTIERVADAAGLNAWAEVVGETFDLPQETRDGFRVVFGEIALGGTSSLSCYLGRLHGEPVATSQIYRTGDVAGVYWVATHPSARRHGIAAAMTGFPLTQAHAAGCQRAILQPSDMGAPVYRRLGFSDAGHFVIHIVEA